MLDDNKDEMILGNTQASTDELFLYTFIHENVNLFSYI